MTKDELRKHCEKTVETQLRYKNSTNGLEQFHSKKVLSEHQLILELLDADAKWLSVIEKIKANIDKLPDLNPDYPMDMTTHVSKWAVFEIIDKAVREVEK